MRLGWLAAMLADRLCSPERPPDFVVGEGDVPYLRRWWLLPRNPLFNVYLHQFLRSDDDRALHDHPWPSLSLLLRGRMVEHTYVETLAERRAEHDNAVDCGLMPTQLMDARLVLAGDVRLRSPWCLHRLELEPGEQCWTLFITGPTVRAWGFMCDGVRWVHWKVFTDTRDGKSVTGRGCE